MGLLWAAAVLLLIGTDEPRTELALNRLSCNDTGRAYTVCVAHTRPVGIFSNGFEDGLIRWNIKARQD